MRHHDHHPAGLVVALLCCLGVLSACGSGSSDTAQPAADTMHPSPTPSPAPEPVGTLTVAVEPTPDSAPLWVAEEEGYFADHGVTVKLVPGSSSASDQVHRVLEGKADLAATTATAGLQAVAEGMPVRLVSGLTEFASSADEATTGLVVAPDSDLHAPADLAGATVALTELDSMPQAAIEAAVKADGGDPSTVTFTKASLLDIPTMVAKGTVDAGFLTDPTLTTARDKGLRLLDSPMSAAAPGLPDGSLVASKDFLRSHVDLISAFEAALDEGVEYANEFEHASDVKKQIAAHTDIPLDELRLANLPGYIAGIRPDDLHAEVELLRASGALHEDVDVDTALAYGPDD